MSDETTLLPCPFCGGEAHTYKNNLWHVACERAHNGCVTMSAFITEAEAVEAWNTRTPEQAIAATLGRGTLTAEQVRKCVRIGACDHGLGDALDEDTDWQAISDELNAELWSGTCKLEPLSALDVTLNMLGQTEWGECSECGCAVPMDAMFCNE